MSIVRWEPLRELGALQNEMNRLFGTVFDPATSAGEGAALRRWIPPMDLIERESDFLLRADLPGMTEADIDIELEDNTLTISGERKFDQETESDGVRRVERSFGAFSRSLTVPKGIDAEKISAKFEQGVLEVQVPKPEERKPHKIAIGASGPKTIEGAETA